MMRVVWTAVLLAAIVDARPAAACSAPSGEPWAHVTFHERTVPRNAELWLNIVDQILAPDSELRLLGPDDVDVAAIVERDGAGGRVVGAVPLTPGSWIFRVRDGEGDDVAETDYAFDVSDSVDVDVPAAPVVTVTSRDVGGFGPLTPIFAPCQPNDRQTIRDVLVDADSEIVRALIDGVVHATVDGDVRLFDVPDDGNEVVVSVFDAAGNESEVVVAGPVTAGGGCASTPGSTVSLALAAALLLFIRRRRTA